MRLQLDRPDDMRLTGKRHPYSADYRLGLDAQGNFLAYEAMLYQNAGCTADLSGPVLTRALCHFDNAYWLPHVAMHGYSGKTNTQSNTAFRGFGGPQGAIAIEFIIDSIARALGKDALDVRRVNYYGRDPLVAFVATLGYSRAAYVKFGRSEDLEALRFNTAFFTSDRIGAQKKPLPVWAKVSPTTTDVAC